MRRSVSSCAAASCRFQALRERDPVRRRVSSRGVEQLVEQDRVAREVFGGPARGADHARDAHRAPGVLGEEREVRAAARDRLDEIRCPRQASPRASGVAGAARASAGHQAIAPAARLLRQRRVALARAQRASRGCCGQRRGGALGSANTSSEMARHRVAHGAPARANAARTRTAHRRDARHGPRRGRQIVASAGRRDTAAGARGCAGRRTRAASRARASQRGSRQRSSSAGSVGRTRAKLRVAAAANELQRLHDELDLADAAGAELDVARELAARRDCSRILAVHVAQAPRTRRSRGTGDRRTAPTSARAAACRRRGDGARLEPGIALPLAALGDEVLLERPKVARASGPESPYGRSRMSTRNTKPSAVFSESAGSAGAPSREVLVATAACALRPSSGYRNTRSTSEDTLSSRPPSLPMPITIRVNGAERAPDREPRRDRSWCRSSSSAASPARSRAMTTQEHASRSRRSPRASSSSAGPGSAFKASRRG